VRAVKDIKRLYSKDIAFWSVKTSYRDVGLDEVEHILIEFDGQGLGKTWQKEGLEEGWGNPGPFIGLGKLLN